MRTRLRRSLTIAGMAIATPIALVAPAAAQRAVSLDEAIGLALRNGPAAAAARADSVFALATFAGARAHPDPVLAATYTRDVPRYHAELEQSLDFLGSRAARIRAAGLSRDAGLLDVALINLRVRYDVTVAYVHALASRRHLTLSERAGADALELVRIARVRQDAGDASELDVGLAQLAAGEADNALVADSLATIEALLELQLLLGEGAAVVNLVPADSLETLEPGAIAPGGGVPLRVVAAEMELRAREADLAFQRRERFPAPSLRAGFDSWDPATKDHQLLPVIGLSFPLPLFDRNRTGIGEARAGIARADARLVAERRDVDARIALAERQRDGAARRVALDTSLVAEAERLAGLAAIAYREGAYPLATVIDAQRAVRATLGRYIDDLAALVLARAALAMDTSGVPE